MLAATLAVAVAGGALLTSIAGVSFADTAAPATSTGGGTTEISAHRTAQALTPDGPPTITCHIDANPPGLAVDGRVGASSFVTCDFPVASIELTMRVQRSTGAVVVVDHVVVQGVSGTGTAKLSSSCTSFKFSEFTNFSIAAIDFPAGYEPAFASIQDSSTEGLGPVICILG